MKDFGKDKDDNFVNYYVPQSEYIRVIEALKEKEEQNLITKEDVDFNYLQYILLRSMRQARYSMKNLGHFGLRKRLLFTFHFTYKEVFRPIYTQNNI